MGATLTRVAGATGATPRSARRRPQTEGAGSEGSTHFLAAGFFALDFFLPPDFLAAFFFLPPDFLDAFLPLFFGAFFAFDAFLAFFAGEAGFFPDSFFAAASTAARGSKNSPIALTRAAEAGRGGGLDHNKVRKL